MDKHMHIDSPRFGTLTVDPERVIDFPVGMAGFEDCRRFTLFHPEDEASDAPRYFILQSLDDASVAFYIADPGQMGFDFDVALSDDEIALLKLQDPADAVVVVILRKDDFLKGTGLKANLNAPIVLNLSARRGLQHVFGTLNYAVKSSSN
jgi:flagellar assembly factor FliW